MRLASRTTLASALAVVVGFSGWGAQPLEAGLWQSDLYGEAAQAALDGRFPSPRIEYLLFDLQHNRIEATRWRNPDQPIPVGSVLKPFVALAYADLQPGSSPVFPVLTCHGGSDGCWHAAGHGSMSLERAIAQSCNAYFLALARAIASSPGGTQAIERIGAHYGLPSPIDPAIATVMPTDLVGLTPGWRLTPLALAQGYARLLTEPTTPVKSRLLHGMRMAALPEGTASRIGAHLGGALAKTGTAPCVATSAERCAANGDGIVIAAFPAREPTQLLLVRKRAATGAAAAETAGGMLSLLEKRDAPPVN